MTTMAVALDRNLFLAYYTYRLNADAEFIPFEEPMLKVSKMSDI